MRSATCPVSDACLQAGSLLYAAMHTPRPAAQHERARLHCTSTRTLLTPAAPPAPCPPLDGIFGQSQSSWDRVVVGPTYVKDSSSLIDSNTQATYHCLGTSRDRASAETACNNCKKYYGKGAGNFGDEVRTKNNILYTKEQHSALCSARVTALVNCLFSTIRECCPARHADCNQASSRHCLMLTSPQRDTISTPRTG